MLSQRRFAPLFAAQFLGVINDNLFKQALLITLAFREAANATSDSLTAAATGLYILPFFLMSAFSGDMADRMDKATLFTRLKLLEIAIMALALIGFLTGSILILLTALTLMGAQSTFFAPCKFGMATERLTPGELTAGTALLGGSTNVAILMGVALGGFLAALPGGGVYAAATGMAIATVGWISARMIQRKTPAAPDRKPNWNLLLGVYRLLRDVLSNPVLRRLIFGIVWFWALAAFMLALTPFFVRDVLGGSETDATLIAIVFTIGVALGALAANIINNGRPILRAAFWGATGLMSAPVIAATLALLLPVNGAIFTSMNGLIVVAAIICMAIAGGMFMVPMQTRLQLKSPDESRGRVFGAMNAVNAAGATIGSALSAAILLFSIPINLGFLIVASASALLGLLVLPSLRGSDN